MNRLFLPLIGAAAVLFLDSTAVAAPPNKLPVAHQVAPFTAYIGAQPASIDLLKAFTDPDATDAVRMTTPYGNIDVVLFGNEAPNTVTNFLYYVRNGFYDGSAYVQYLKPGASIVGGVFHRSQNEKIDDTPVKAIWGGLVYLATGDGTHPSLGSVQALGTIKNEFKGISNDAGTITMWKGGGADTATTEWAINITDNGGPPLNLNTRNGGYTVFGRVLQSSMVNAVNTINNVPRYDLGFPYDPIPLVNYDGSSEQTVQNFVVASKIAVIPPMRFVASSSTPSVATVELSGTHLLVHANAAGTATINMTATDLDGASVSQSFKVTVTTSPGRLANISTRAQVGTGDNVTIAGFIVKGTHPKRLLVRGVGPSLTAQHVPNPLADPKLRLIRADGSTVDNDNWQKNANYIEIRDSKLAPKSLAESAILTTVNATPEGTHFTAVLSGVNDGTGIGLLEVFDLDPGPSSTIYNISTRGRVDTGDNVMIGGFIVAGNESKTVVVRALGPSLTQRGVPGALPDPQVKLFNGQGTQLEENNDWQTSAHKAEIESSQLAPTDPKEAAIYRVLAPGAYTAIVSGVGAAPAGVALVEAYQLP